MKSELVFTWVCVAFLLGFFTGAILVGLQIRNELQRQAVEKGFMIYNPTTGKKEWVEK